MNIIAPGLKAAIVLIISTVCLSANAQINLPKVIGSNMVLQSKQVLPIWGWAAKEGTVTVIFAGQQKTATADANGYWKVNLPALKPSAAPAEMLITSGKDTARLKNILVGEVWLCSGQSNMEYVMKNNYVKPVIMADSTALALTDSKPQIRIFMVQKKLGEPDVVTTGWHEAGGEALEKFSAPAYFFAKNLNRALGVPVGAICTAWGGTQIEPWTPAVAYFNEPIYKDEITAGTNMMNGVKAGSIYESMVKPMIPFAVKGFLWYQGESNAITNDGMHYADKMKTLVNSWRAAWGDNALPFYYVALAPHYYTKRKDKLPHTIETLPMIWEAQTAALSLSNTEMIPISDLVDHLGDIHPPYKWEVGRRLATLALAKNYGYKNREYTGPRFKSLQVKGNKAIVNFTHAEGLKTSDAKPANWLTIAGADGVFKPAIGDIMGNKLVVSSPEVPNPTQVRLGWDEAAQPNLVNSAGLPVMPFRVSR